jgi:hypothetical protein
MATSITNGKHLHKKFVNNKSESYILKKDVWANKKGRFVVRML